MRTGAGESKSYEASGHRSGCGCIWTGAAVLLLAGAIACAGCSEPASGAMPAGCSRILRLSVTPDSAPAGSLVRLVATGAGRTGSGWRESAIESPGIFGRSVRGRVQASYSVEGQAPPKAHHVPDTPVTSPDDTLGVGLSDAPFVVEVPDVRGGVYWITFDFSVPFGISIRVDSKTLGAGTYRMCVPIRVTSR
jgi:hypothetical protein